jgi:two-component system, OmpR family, sensor kinase
VTRTPDVRRTLSRSALLATAAALLVFDLLVFLSVQRELERSLDDLLDSRMSIALGIAAERPPEAAIESLEALGVPAALVNGDGVRAETLTVTPSSGGLALPSSALEPRVSREAALDDGSSLVVYASRQGTDRALSVLAASLAVGTAIALAVSYGLFSMVSRRGLAPLASVARTAQRIEAGSQGERLRPDRPETDLGRMAHAFDEMVESLERARSRTEQERRRTQHFLDHAAHQLRTPITALRSSAESLLRQDDREARDRSAATIVREAWRCGRLLNNLLLLARLEGAVEPSFHRDDLRRMVDDEIGRAQRLSPRVDFRLVAPDGPIFLPMTDELPEVVANLLDNARRHAEVEVEVEVEVDEDAVRVWVRDDGPGVAPEARERIFERFVTGGGEGSGLGLAIARTIAREHGGDVSTTGDAFLLDLPIVSGQPQD